MERRESDVERKIRVWAKAAGWWTSKITGTRGIMDRVFIKNGTVIWGEIKRKGEQANAQQIHRKQEMEQYGAVCFIWDNVEDAKKILTLYSDL